MKDLPKILQQMKSFGSGKIDPLLETQAKVYNFKSDPLILPILFIKHIG